MWELLAWHCFPALPEGLTSGRGSALRALLCLFPLTLSLRAPSAQTLPGFISCARSTPACLDAEARGLRWPLTRRPPLYCDLPFASPVCSLCGCLSARLLPGALPSVEGPHLAFLQYPTEVPVRGWRRN